MAIKGNLQDFSITQLLNLINLAKKTGALYVETLPKRLSYPFEQENWHMLNWGMMIP